MSPSVLNHECVRSKREKTTLHVRIERGYEGNLLSLQMIAALEATIRSAADCNVIALTSAGPDFCLGRDRSDRPVMQTALDVRDKLTRPIMGLYDAIASSPAPIICAVQGRASGLGCALATSCDITLAADDAIFQLPELEGNLPPTLAISAMMTRVPRKALAWLIYSMRPIGARDAMVWGLASELVPAAALLSRLEEMTADLALRSREALVAIKEYLRTAPAMTPQGAEGYAMSLLASVLSSTRN